MAKVIDICCRRNYHNYDIYNNWVNDVRVVCSYGNIGTICINNYKYIITDRHQYDGQ